MIQQQFRTFFYFSVIFSICFTSFYSSLQADIDLEDISQNFVIEAKKIEVPGYPNAFNPSIVEWKGNFIMSFRVILVPTPPYVNNSWTGIVFLDRDFNPIGKPQILSPPPQLARLDDARLLTVGDQLWIVHTGHNKVDDQYDCQDCSSCQNHSCGLNIDFGKLNPFTATQTNSYYSCPGKCRMYVAELVYDGQSFNLEHEECLTCFEGSKSKRNEKNWVPFDYAGHLLLAYSLKPHRIFHPLLTGQGTCETLASTTGLINWNFGELRGGTPAILDNNQYLAFFHSTKSMKTVHSDGACLPHYFMGAYTFSSQPPFEITNISANPIVAPGFYKGLVYEPYWHPVRVIFPSGLILDEQFIWVSYGRQDHEAWVVKMDKQKLLESLVPVSTVQKGR